MKCIVHAIIIIIITTTVLGDHGILHLFTELSNAEQTVYNNNGLRYIVSLYNVNARTHQPSL